MAQIVAKSRSTGVIYFGGEFFENVPPNERDDGRIHAVRGHKYAIQVITDVPYPVDTRAPTLIRLRRSAGLRRMRSVTVRCDATIAISMLVTSSPKQPQAMRTRKRINSLLGVISESICLQWPVVGGSVTSGRWFEFKL